MVCGSFFVIGFLHVLQNVRQAALACFKTEEIALSELLVPSFKTELAYSSAVAAFEQKIPHQNTQSESRPVSLFTA
jgi:hypothetical protein